MGPLADFVKSALASAFGSFNIGVFRNCQLSKETPCITYFCLSLSGINNSMEKLVVS
jgi:hypothetical protein